MTRVYSSRISGKKGTFLVRSEYTFTPEYDEPEKLPTDGGTVSDKENGKNQGVEHREGTNYKVISGFLVGVDGI